MEDEPPSEATVGRAMALNRQHHGAPGPWVTDKAPVVDKQVKEFPYKPTYRHQYWYVDFRWENLIESQFKVQLRLADAHFEQAETFAEIQDWHAAFVETFDTTAHWAHRERADGLRRPVEVLGWVRGKEITPEELQWALRDTQLERTVSRAGYVSVQRFYVYAERGLACWPVSIWLYDGRLQIALEETLLARHACRYDRRAHRLKAVEQPQLYRTAFASPQLELWELDDEQWRKVLERSPYRRLTRSETGPRSEQLCLPIPDTQSVS